MSKDNVIKIKDWITDNIVVAVLGCILGWGVWSNNKQLEAIGLKQDLAIQRAAAEANGRFVSKEWFQQEDGILKSVDANNAAAVASVAASVAEIKTSIAVINEKIHK